MRVAAAIEENKLLEQMHVLFVLQKRTVQLGQRVAAVALEVPGGKILGQQQLDPVQQLGRGRFLFQTRHFTNPVKGIQRFLEQVLLQVRRQLEQDRPAPRAQRQRLVENPGLFLKAVHSRAEEAADKRLAAGPEGAWYHDLRVVSAILARLAGQVPTLFAPTQDAAERDRQMELFRRKVQLLVDGLNAIDGISCKRPRGAFYVFPGCEGLFGAVTPDEDPEERAAALLESVGLADRLGALPTTLSGGERQILAIARAVYFGARVLILDEPAGGLDPHARHELWKVVEQVKARGKTIILTTHYMEEAARLCDQIAIMDFGKIIARGTPEELIRQSIHESGRKPGVGVHALNDDLKEWLKTALGA